MRDNAASVSRSKRCWEAQNALAHNGKEIRRELRAYNSKTHVRFEVL